jgi:hypothetical protein
MSERTAYEVGYQDFFDGKTGWENPYDFNTPDHHNWDYGWYAAQARSNTKQTFVVRHAYNRDFYDFAAGGWGKTLTTGCFVDIKKAYPFYQDDPKGLWLIKVSFEVYLTESEERLPLEF